MIGRRLCDKTNGCGEYYKGHLLNCHHCNTPNEFSDFLPFPASLWSYDLECYPNIFTFYAKHLVTGAIVFFEISDRVNQANELYTFLEALKKMKCKMVGFNNIGYDYPMLHFFILNYTNSVNHIDLYSKSKLIIDTPWNERYSNVIWDNDTLIPQIDLFKIHHFDNQARSTSLKIIEFNLCMETIEDLPFPPGTTLNHSQKDVLIKYNGHDVLATEDFLIQSLEMLSFREELSIKYNRNFLNHNDKKIGTDSFIIELEKIDPNSCYQKINGIKTKRQTIRDEINLKNIIFPYIYFENLQFNLIKNWLEDQVIVKTKGVFEFISVSSKMAMYMNPERIKVYNVKPGDVPSLSKTKNLETVLRKGILLSKCKKDLMISPNLNTFDFVSGWSKVSGLNCVIKGFEYDFGTGGIHGSIEPSTVVSDDEYEIWDWDVAGFYPEVGSANNLFPEHLSNTFCKVNENLKQERKKYKKGTPLNRSIKLARNGAYGDSNSIYSPLYDPQYTMSITINGQLLLCMLAQYLIEIPDLKMIQINTDGMTVHCPKKHVQVMKNICKWWEGYTRLELESVVYKRMFIRDVNSYIAEKMNGNLKRKGVYAYTRVIENANTQEREWHQNHSALVVAKAAEAALVHGQDIRDFITNHKNIFDFMLRTKINKSDKLVSIDNNGIEVELQRVTRYYISNDVSAVHLCKISSPMKGKEVGQWARSNSLTDEFYKGVLAELKTTTTLNTLDLDSTGLPWDSRINTKSKSKYTIRREGLNVGFKVVGCNNINVANRNNINFDYYIAETRKIVDQLRE